MIVTVDGAPVYVYTGTRPQIGGLRTLVFVHGAGQDHSVWALQSRYVAHHGRNVLAVDLPGHGRSPGPPLASIEEMSAWLLDVLDAAGAPSADAPGTRWRPYGGADPGWPHGTARPA